MNIAGKQQTVRFLIHLLCLGILFVVPEVLTSLSHPTPDHQLWVYTKAAVFIAVFYIDYYAVIPLTFRGQHPVVRFTLWNLVIIVCALAVLHLIWYLSQHYGIMIAEPRGPRMPHHEGARIARWIPMLVRDVVMTVLVIALAIALRLGDKWMEMETKKKELVGIQREEELKNLKSQLNPHFLFNTLNSIYALIAISPEKAQGAVHTLSHLLRYVLYDSPVEVELSRELSFIDDYVGLMKLRLNPRIKVDVRLEADEQAGAMKIAPLLFITLVENVFKHGIHTPDVPLMTHIKAADGMVECTTSNGYREHTEDSSTRAGGIGIRNLERRLALIYGTRATFRVNASGGIYTTFLTINIAHHHE